ncbi:hypothetical protein PM082_022832 [Marasmius tenuissimus]|nr:hypothetical protein PM082_022832 [Marasmius tenuissimus]
MFKPAIPPLSPPVLISYSKTPTLTDQSVPFYENCYDSRNDLVCINEVQFSLVGTFQSNPTSSTTPVPRITVVEEPDIPEDIDGFSEQSEHQDDANDIGLIPLDQPSSEALETRCIETNHIETSTSSSNKDDQEGPKARSIHDLAPSLRSSQSYSNEYQLPAWPRAIYELFVLVWSIAVVILSVGVDRVTRVVGRTSLKNMGVRSIAETERNYA